MITGAVLVVLPLGRADWTIPALEDPERADRFLSTLWQVEAAAIALSLAIVLFSFELVWSSRFRGSLRQFAREIWLVLVLALSFGALIGIGLVLIDYGSGAPGGWAATCVTVLSGLALASLPVLLVLALAATDPAALQERRLRQIRSDVIAAVEADILERFGASVLNEEAQAAGLDVQPGWFTTPPAGSRVVYAERSGVVEDIRLFHMRLLGAGQAAARPAVCITLGDFVSPERVIAFLPQDAPRRRDRAARRMLKLADGEQRSPIREITGRLHEEALDAIRAGRPTTYEDLAGEYVELLSAFPVAWARYGQPFEGAAAGVAHPFLEPPLERLTRNLYEELREATIGSSVDVFRAAYSLPYRVASRAVELNAGGIVTEMLTLYAWLYSVTARAIDEDIGRRARQRCIETPFEIARIHVGHELQRDTIDEARRTGLEKLLDRCFDTITELARETMSNPQDLEALSEINGQWSQLLQGWHPEYQLPEDTEVEVAERQHGRDHPDTVRLKRDAELRKRQLRTKKQASARRATLRFGLAYWALHKLRTTSDPAWVKPLNVMRRYFGGLTALSDAADDAVQYDRRDPWFYWRLSESRGAPGAGPQVEWELIRAYLSLAVFHVEPTLPPPKIKRLGFLEAQLREVEQILESVRADTELWRSLTPPADIDRRWAMLRRALRRAGSAAQ